MSGLSVTGISRERPIGRTGLKKKDAVNRRKRKDHR